MGEIIRFPRREDGGEGGEPFDMARLRQVAGMDRRQHITALRARTWRFPTSMYRTWEAGATPPPQVVRDAAQRLASEAASSSGESSVSRRKLFQASGLIGLTGIAQLAGLPEDGLDPGSPDRLAYVLRYPSRIDQECLRQLERTTILLQKLEGESRREALLGSVRGHLAEVLWILKHGSLGTQTRQRLWSIAAETAGTAGWLVWQSDDKEAASAVFRFGLEAASESGNRGLCAYLVGCLATQPHYREDPALRLQQLTGGAFGCVQGDAPPATRAWLAVIEAEAHALLGRTHDAFEGLNRAEAIMSQGGDIAKHGRPAVPSSFGAFFSSAYLVAEEGVVRAKLGESTEATAVLEPLIQSVDPDRRKNWYWLYPILAGAYVQQGNVEGACQLATEALQGSMRMQVSTNLPLVMKVQGQLEPHRTHPAVQLFDEAIREATEAVGW